MKMKPGAILKKYEPVALVQSEDRRLSYSGPRSKNKQTVTRSIHNFEEQ